MNGSELKETAQEAVTCRVCGTTYVPSFFNDFYADGVDPKIGRCERCFLTEVLARPRPIIIPEDKFFLLCKAGKGEATCSFLILGKGGFMCAKGTDFQPEIDRRRAAGKMGAMGNNCSGSPKYEPIV